MGTFSVEISIGDSARERWVTMDALVDTGSTMTSATPRRFFASYECYQPVT